MRSSNVVDALRHHARERPNHTAVMFLANADGDGISWTYRDLDRRAAEIATSLIALDMPGRNALLIHPPGLEFIAALFGCFYSGVTAVPTYPPRFRPDSRADARWLALMEDATPAAVLTTEASLAKARKDQDTSKWFATDGPDFRRSRESAEPIVKPDSLAILQYTSGSTRTPRGVMLTHRNLMDNQRVIAEHMQHSTQSHMVSWLPPYHDMGLIGGILQPITVGFPLTLMDSAHVLQRPVRWLQVISRMRATTSGAPNSIFELCARSIPPEQLRDLDLRSWRVAFNGSEPIRSDTLKRFVERFEPCGFQSDSFFLCYGLAESTLLMTGRNGVRIDTSENRPIVSCGTPGSTFDVSIVDPLTQRECPDNHVGEIWASGASVARGYWNRPDETAGTFGSSLVGRTGCFLRTGDLGFLRNGELFVTGRIKDLIIIRGRNFYPQDIEFCAGSAHQSLSPDKCAAFSIDGSEGERMVVACEVRREDRRRIDASRVIHCVREAIAEDFDIGVSPILLLQPASLPRTTSGKVRRSAARQAFIGGTLEVIARDPHDPQLSRPVSGSSADRIRRELAAVLSVPEYSFDDEKPLAGQGIDSLARVELLLRLEAEFGVQLDPTLINLDITLKDFIAAIDKVSTAPQPVSSAQDPVPVECGRRVPLTPSQLAFLNDCEERTEQYSMIIALRTPAGLDVEALVAALQSFERHDALRLRFRREDGGWIQEYGSRGTALGFHRVDVRGVTGDELEHMGEKFFTDIAGDFNLVEGPVMQAALFDRGTDQSGVLFLSVHHLVADGSSIPLLLLELENRYRNSRSPIDAPMAYADWARRLETIAQSEEVGSDLPYWRDVCMEGSIGSYANDGLAMESTPIARLTPAESTEFLGRFKTSQEQHDAVLAALAHAWTENTGERHLYVQLESHGRFPIGGDAPIRTVGWCASHFPVRIIDGGRIEVVPHHGLSFGLLKYLCRNPEIRCAMQELPMPKVAMVYRGRMDDDFRADFQFPIIAKFVLDETRRKPDTRPTLTLYAGVEDQRVWFQIKYAPTLFGAGMISQLVSCIRADTTRAPSGVN